MRWLAVAAATVHRDFHFVAFGLVDHSAILGAPGENSDFASFSFQTPMKASWAKPTGTPTRHRATVSTIVLIFMSLLIGKRIVGRIMRIILVPHGAPG